MKAFVVEQYGKSGLRATQLPEPTIGRRDLRIGVFGFHRFTPKLMTHSP